MSKTSNKLILVLGIIAFIFGLLLATPAFARESFTMRSGVDFDADTYSNNRISNYNNSSVIPGCEGRTTGFSTVTGQSCYGNNVGNTTPTTIVRNYYNNYSTNNVPPTTKAPTSKPEVVAATSTNTYTSDTTTSDINDSYGNLSANALFGSNSFMPTGLIQWVFSILLIIAIIFLWRYVHKSEEKYMGEPMKHA